MTPLNGTAVAIRGRGVLLQGPSGAGKSDLALRLIDRGAVLIGDDWVAAVRAGDQVDLCALARLRGLIEVRGLGLVHLPYTTAPLALVVALGGPVERLPEPELADILGCGVRLLRLDARTSSAPILVELALGPGAQPLGR